MSTGTTTVAITKVITIAAIVDRTAKPVMPAQSLI
jgi:hypothetical protein